MRTNAPKLVTIALAVGLTLVGLAVTVFDITAVQDAMLEFLGTTGLNVGLDEAGWAALLASPLLLAVGSLLKGV